MKKKKCNTNCLTYKTSNPIINGIISFSGLNNTNKLYRTLINPPTHPQS